MFVYAGLLPWTFLATATTNGTSSLVSHAQLVTKVYFPREILPLTCVVAAFADLAIAVIGLILLAVWFDLGWTANKICTVGDGRASNAAVLLNVGSAFRRTLRSAGHTVSKPGP